MKFLDGMNCLLDMCVSLIDREGSLIEQGNFGPSVRCLRVSGMIRPGRIHNLMKKVPLKKSKPGWVLDPHCFTVDWTNTHHLIYFGLLQPAGVGQH